MESGNHYLTCEKNWVYYTLITISGFFGAFTYLLRGNVFCNAQTGNVVLLGLALGEGKWSKAVYYLIPIFAYIAGAFFSELLPNPIKHKFGVRWDTVIIAVEIIAVIILGFIPESAPVQISQIMINFIASMQYNTFREAEGTPMATTFATNHIRQIGIGLAKEVRHIHKSDKTHRERLKKHAFMLFFFLAGAVIGKFICSHLKGRAIWLTLIPFVVLFVTFIRADVKSNKDELEQKPLGH